MAVLTNRILNYGIISRLTNTSYGAFRTLFVNQPSQNEAESVAEPAQTAQTTEGGEEEKPRGNKTSLRDTPFVEIDPETSMRYMDSDAYKTTYGNEPVWLHYRRNYKGQYERPTRKKCVRKGQYATGNPCPVCRDNHLVPYYRNVKLLNQFISPYSGQVLDSMQTGICQHQYRSILIAVEQAWDYGLIDMPFTRRSYDYKDYYGDLMKDDESVETKEAS